MGEILDLIRGGNDTPLLGYDFHNKLRSTPRSFTTEELGDIWREGYPLFRRLQKRVTFLRSFIKNARHFVPPELAMAVLAEVRTIAKQDTRRELMEALFRNGHMTVFQQAMTMQGIKRFLEGSPSEEPGEEEGEF